MTALRGLRIVAIAVGFFVIFTFSQHATKMRQGTTVPGIAWAIGVLAMIFLVSAIVAERSQGPEDNLRKDVLWGLATGGIGIVLSRLAT